MTIFRVIRFDKNGQKAYWNGEECPYGDGGFYTEDYAYVSYNMKHLTTKIRRCNTKYNNDYYNIQKGKSMFANCHIEISEITPTEESIPVESLLVKGKNE